MTKDPPVEVMLDGVRVDVSVVVMQGYLRAGACSSHSLSLTRSIITPAK